jgi:hypothetical protein
MNINDIKFTWMVYDLHVAPSANNQSNVILKTNWTLHAGYTDPVSGNFFEEELLGTSIFKFDESKPFIPFENLNQDVVLGWIIEKENTKQRNVAWKYDDMAKKLEEKVNPKQIILKNPFNITHPTDDSKPVI